MRRTLIFNLNKNLPKGQHNMFDAHDLLFQRKIVRFAKRSAHTRAYIYKV